MKLVITAPDFQIQSEAASTAIRTATLLVEWTHSQPANRSKFNQFFSSLDGKFQQCFSKSSKSVKYREESMRRAYHKLASSTSFKNDWERFLLESISKPASPAFFQFISDTLFGQAIKEHFELPKTVSGVAYPQKLTDLEEKALRYVAGYVIRKVKNKIEKSSVKMHPHKDDMVLFMSSELSGDEWFESTETEEWVNAVDRGGLWHVTDNVYTLFYIAEVEIKSILRRDILKAGLHADDSLKEKLMHVILGNEDLQFVWSTISTTIDNEIGGTILKMVVELYTTVRGFAFASACLELYKQRMKKGTQKSQAMRKTLAIE